MAKTSSAAQDKRRVFFALWPEEGTRASLAALARKAHQRFGGRPMHADALHMTMTFIGDIEAALVDAAQAAAGELGAQPAFSMAIDQLRCWRHNRIVWCGPRALPPALAETARLLRERLSAAGFQLESRPFAAHATLLRNADCSRAVPDFEPFGWEVKQFVLVESSLTAAGARYTIVGRWPLAG